MEATRKEASDAELQAARRLYQSDDIAIDDGAGVSDAGTGVWVQAWVYVPKADMGDGDAATDSDGNTLDYRAVAAISAEGIS